LRSFAQGLVLITLSLYRSQHFALYVQGRVQDASGLGLTKQVALYVQGLVLITNSLDRRQHFALYVQAGCKMPLEKPNLLDLHAQALDLV
jgi:hypothetical protein